MESIMDTGDLAADEGLEDGQVREHMTATKDADPNAKIEFHVQMRSWTMQDMEALIVAAAASQMIKSFGERSFFKLIEDRAISAITAKADEKLAAITTEIIDQPLTPNFGDKAPVTMREFIGLYAKEYLTQTVDSSGAPSKGGWGTSAVPRMQWLVAQALDRKFKNEIEKATNAAITEIQRSLWANHEALIAVEKKRISDAIAKALTA